MRPLIIFLFFATLHDLAVAQNTATPLLPKNIRTADQSVPKGYHLLKKTQGDLNGDGFADIAAIYEADKAVTENRAYGDAGSEFIKEFQRPRLLAIYFSAPKNMSYNLALQNNYFILRAAEGGAMGEPVKDLLIANNELGLYFEGGNEWRWKLNYQFKYNEKDWQLIKATNTFYNSNSGEMTQNAFDFDDRTVTLTRGNIYNRKAANQSSEENLYFSQPRTFKTLKKPWTWEILDNCFL